MPINAIHLIAACMAMVVLTFIVGALVLFTRVSEMRKKRIHPQAAATSVQVSARLEMVQPSDNFKNLFEIPVLFYTLMAIAVSNNQVPSWLVVCAWLFVALRFLHSLIHCTYNKVYHRLAAFMAGFGLLVGMWCYYFLSIVLKSAA